ncbi:hypothetical protein SPRG_10415 [Saprolegnia parasitica CBS 223.65]|uniref:VLIG-type G domain-containing protein n=1 Tax=Saprolegnia parasitica (strain CBS 223.65) TaxID=695850 RepID=A0A067C1E4_SAPPC|nr:hypothetical protein SPRG_10415 [Saprolegnia parasitica CBS 223.65]KDO24338.1 hypothetical protein SPRG_10415 [Saprolegnia parasitica CBS 223.65]|eukprot:XP_012204933.1 hypothetical protein SPRG_10415 [Saprolegnia parasitica CBS 223.65]
MTLTHGTVLHWRIADDDEDDEVLGDDGKVLTVALASPMTSSYERITAYILDDDEADTPPTRRTVDKLALPDYVLSEPVVLDNLESVLAETDFATLRTDVLQLQQRFAVKSALRINLQRETSGPNQQVLRQKIASCEDEHKKLMLQHSSAAVREMLVIDLERRLAECTNAVAATAQAECGQAFAACSDVDDEATRSAYALALKKWSNMVTGLEHLWREISHIYTTNQEAYATSPSSPCSISSMGFRLSSWTWIRAVLNRLEATLAPGARVFVLSVMGVQSSGKSTLLNSMFGVRLRTSVARCTRGVNLQLLACNNCDDYDYVLLLDTEGIQSPEYVGVEGTVWRDNRMASVAILPADATIILTKGEATNTINDVLPIVLSAFANSELAAASGGHLSSKLYFAFNQIDVSQTNNMASSLRALLDSLRNSAKQIAAVRQTETATFLSDFRADIADEAGSDVRFLGMTQGQTTPPNDVPLPDFGERLVRFRDHMHTRATESQWQAAIVATSLNQDAFAKWATTMLEGWVVKKQRQAAHSARLVQAKVQHLFEYDAITKVYKEKLQAKIVDHNARFGPEETMQAFDNIFGEILDDARKENPAFASQVPKHVRAVIHNNHIFTPDELARLNTDDNDEWTPVKLATKVARKFSNVFVSKDTTPRDTEVTGAVCDLVRSLLADVDRYSDDVALSCARDVQRLLASKQLTPSQHKAGLRALTSMLTDELQLRQLRWDEANSVVAKFAACKASMLLFAQNVCDGQKAAQLLSTTLDEWLGLNLAKAFEEEVVSVVASSLKHARWVRAADAMQAALDTDLLQYLRKKKTRKVLSLIEEPTAHAADMTSTLVLKEVQKCYVNVSKKLVRDIEESVATAADAATHASSERTKCFVHALRVSLQSRLKCSGTSALIENLPAAPGVMNCDDQGPSAFALTTDQDAISVPQALLRRLRATALELRPSTACSSTMTKAVIGVIRNEAYGAVDGIVPRCGAPCPRCCCPCTKALGHTSTKDDALHDTYHQPGGLVGGWVDTTHELVYRSCATSVVDDIGIVFASGVRPYRDFEAIYPGWALPRVTKFLPLREYIFKQCQSELSQKFNKLPCTSIPISYAHNLDDIGTQLERLLH